LLKSEMIISRVHSNTSNEQLQKQQLEPHNRITTIPQRPRSSNTVYTYTGRGAPRTVRQVYFPPHISYIGSWAFFNCAFLTSVTIPPTITSIYSNAFNGCQSLETIVFSPTIVSIGDNAFRGCNSLESIDLPPSVQTIAKYTFQYCTALSNIIIPSSVSEIGYEAFRGCRSLTTVTIPSSVTSIASNAFRGCNALTSIDILPSPTKNDNNANRATTPRVYLAVIQRGGFSQKINNKLGTLTNVLRRQMQHKIHKTNAVLYTADKYGIPQTLINLALRQPNQTSTTTILNTDDDDSVSTSSSNNARNMVALYVDWDAWAKYHNRSPPKNLSNVQ